MIRKYLSIILIGLIAFAADLQTISAQTISANSIAATEKIKTNIYRHGIGEKAKVVVRMRDGMRLKGYISQTIEHSFDLTDSKTRQITTISYRDVAQVKKQGMSKMAKIAIGAGIVAVVVLVVIRAGVKAPSGSFCPLGCGPF